MRHKVQVTYLLIVSNLKRWLVRDLDQVFPGTEPPTDPAFRPARPKMLP